MSNYTILTNYAAKDALISGNPAKRILGADFTNEFTAVQTAVNSKVDGSVVFFPNGNAAQPSVGFTSNNGTGLFNSGGTLGFATGGSQRLSINASGNIVATAPASGVGLSASAA